MAQETTSKPGTYDGTLQAEQLATVVAASGNTPVLTLKVAGIERVSIEVRPTVQALDAFLIEVQVHPSGGWRTLTSSVTSTPAGQVVAASGTLASIAAAGFGWVLLDVRGFYGVRVSVSAAIDGMLVDAFATGF